MRDKELTKDKKLSFKKRWQLDCVSFWLWTQADSSNFTEVMFAAYGMMLGILMCALAVVSDTDADSLLRWTIAATAFLVSGGLGLHIVYRWHQWEWRNH